MPELVPYPGRRRGAASATMGVAASRDGRQTVDREWWPVVVVPGIMGSRIEKADGSDRLWDPDRTPFMLWLMSQSPDTLSRLYDHRVTPGRTMREIYVPNFMYSGRRDLDEDDDADELAIGLTRDERNWGSVAWEYYGPGCVAMQRQIAAEGGVIWCCGYDYRRDNIDSGLALKNFINDVVRPTSPIKPIIVTHSMGGLVTRAACAVHGMEDMVSGVIHTMMPTYGAAEAYGSQKHGSMNFPFSRLIGDTREEINCVSAGVTGMFQLMPCGQYPRRDWATFDSRLASHLIPQQTYSLDNPYEIYRERSGHYGVANHETFNANVVNTGANRYVHNTQRLLRHILANIDASENYHHRQVRNYCHPRTWILAGDHTEGTVLQANVGFHQPYYRDIALNIQSPTALVTGDAGDQTVPLVSGRALENAPGSQGGYTINGVVHSASVNDATAINATVDMIRASRAHQVCRW